MTAGVVLDIPEGLVFELLRCDLLQKVPHLHPFRLTSRPFHQDYPSMSPALLRVCGSTRHNMIPHHILWRDLVFSLVVVALVSSSLLHYDGIASGPVTWSSIMRPYQAHHVFVNSTYIRGHPPNNPAGSFSPQPLSGQRIITTSWL